MKGTEIRSRFINFFKNKNHTIKPSASLIPDDPTILFSIAGMVQFKKMFLGEVELEFTRAATSQKCVRTNDIENVGRTARHHTFFEMLGNFSFGDYFKEEAIAWAWEFLTNDIKLPIDKLYVTIYKDDNESFDIWHNKMNLPVNRIFRLGEDTNFWTMGETGPCGPCSEIMFDLGEEFGCGKTTCTVGCDCDRYLELWNLVFTQYDKQYDGKLLPLPKKNIDTGMGLERLARVMQKTKNNFETDLIFPIIKDLEILTGIKYGDSPKTDVNLKVIADHIRAITFLINDGVNPSNEERGYVLRRLIRRSIVHARLLNYKTPFLHKFSDNVIRIFSDAYPELIERKAYINIIILIEEENFIKTLERAQNTLEEIIDKCNKNGVDTISGEDAFILSDTYGLPISMTETFAETYNLKIDLVSYEKLLKEQQSRSRENWHERTSSESEIILKNLPSTGFVGYDSLSSKSKILFLTENNLPCEHISNENCAINIILDKSPFYAESGGQLGDIGIITNGKENKIVIENTIKKDNYHIHIGKLIKGKFSKGDLIEALVDEQHRNSTARNHTATHLLQAALRNVLGSHVNQSGSLVSKDYLRFDFSHFSGINKREIECIERLINEQIFENFQVDTTSKSLAEARADGATALFGEKYGDSVRVVKIGSISKELCGGTHVKSTGEIGMFKILKEESVASGIRRIEAITAHKVLEYLYDKEMIINDLCEITKSTPEILKNKIIKLQDNIKELEKEQEKLKKQSASSELDKLMNSSEEIKGVNIISGILQGLNDENLKGIIDDLKNKFTSGIFVLGSINPATDKPVLAIGVVKNFTAKVHAGNIIKEASIVFGGKGGGRPDLACAGGNDVSKLNETVEHAVKLIKEKL